LSKLFPGENLLIEQENGSDEYIHDVRQDIFDRFNKLKDALRRVKE